MARVGGICVRQLAGISLLLSPTGLWAAPAPAQVAPLSLGSVFSVLFGLVVVVALLLGTAWLIRRLQGLQQPGLGTIQPVAQLQLGLKERILLIRVDQQNVLIGCTPQGIRALHAWEGPPPQGILPAGEGMPMNAPFVEHLKRLLGEKK